MPVKLRRGILILLLLMNFRTFEYFPGFRAVQELWYVLSVVLFITMYPLFKIVLDWTFTGLELYLLLLLPVLYVLPAWTAHTIFGQPFLYGLLPERGSSPMLFWLLFLNAWRCGWFDWEDLEAAFLLTLWGTFVLFNLMRFTLHPASYANPGFVIGTGSDAVFSFPAYFTMFGTLYYIFDGIRNKRILSYLIGAMFLFSSLGGSGRYLSVSFASTIAVFLLGWRGLVRSLPVFASIAVALTVLIGISYAVSPASTEERLSKYQQAFQVAEGVSAVEDPSANARVTETAVAKPYIAAHPLLGVGTISAQWGGGLDALVGDYFVPGDIGLVGITFTYGFVGLFLFLLQYAFALHAFYQSYSRPSSRFLDATAGFVLLSAIYSVVTALFVFNIEVTSFFVVLLTLPNISQAARGRVFSGPEQAWLRNPTALPAGPADGGMGNSGSDW